MTGRYPPPTIVVDTREQLPWRFDTRLVRELLGRPIATVRGTLAEGDYAVQGMEGVVAIERKSLPDFVMSVTTERPRFWAELERLQPYRVRAVVIEASVVDVEVQAYRSQARPQSIIASALAISADFGIPVVWSGCRESAEYHAAWLLRRAWQRHLAEEEQVEATAP
jgi:DNA excision repair protein ERCC-4